MYVCTNEINNSKTVQSNQSESKVNVCQSEKKRSNTEKFKITKADEYQSEIHPIQRFEIIYDIHKLP